MESYFNIDTCPLLFHLVVFYLPTLKRWQTLKRGFSDYVMGKAKAKAKKKSRLIKCEI